MAFVIFGAIAIWIMARQEPSASISSSQPQNQPNAQLQAQSQPANSDCHPSYSGCLDPDASDYDCEGGSGNGPLYTGRVRVSGPDVFELDRDRDGWGCE